MVELRTPFYVQLFSIDIPIFRIFIYVLNGKCLASVEAFETLLDLSEAVKHVSRILKDLDFEANFTSVGSAIQKRHIFYTPQDLAKFKQFDHHPNVLSGEIINAGWVEYGRDNKINRIFESFTTTDQLQKESSP